MRPPAALRLLAASGLRSPVRRPGWRGWRTPRGWPGGGDWRGRGEV